MAGEAGLDYWVSTMHPRLASFQDWGLPEDFPFDFSVDSLGRLEALLLDRFADAVEVLDTEDGFVVGAVGYLGESLLRVGGGSWTWDDDPDSDTYDSPMASLDGGIDLPALSPLDLLADAAEQRTGRRLAEEYATVEEAVRQQKIQDPSWSPSKAITPGLDGDLELNVPESLLRWLAEREAAFPQWVTSYAGGGPWDFTPESLDLLENVARQIVKPGESLEGSPNRGFVDGAAWYLGEVTRRAIDGQWSYHEGDPDPFDPWVGRPFLMQTVADGIATVPELELELALNTDEVGYLRRRLAVLIS